MNDLHATADALVAPGKGILAADESTGTIKKRFDSIGVESSPDSRRSYRQMLLTTPGLGEHISGVILFDETIRQATDDGVPFAEVLRDAGVIPGIKVDTGAKALALFPGETVTEGLDGLRERLAEYRELGARFAKWRATVFIDETAGLPTAFAIDANAHAMARYAALCQEAGLVPIVEPEILMDGGHDLEACEGATGRTLAALYRALADHRVDLPGSLLKVNMVLPGKGSAAQQPDATIAEATVRCLSSHVPADVPGVVFLSGGMSDEEATSRLNAMNARGEAPWQLSFSYGRALQQPSLKAWKGDPANVAAGQEALAHRARMNGLARSGNYTPDLESAA
ncbi:MAG TPA: class I fructose-bisphosphate aldolase [Actinomycetota bacterium]|jgi:fructose-bisphosphate aldolase class I